MMGYTSRHGNKAADWRQTSEYRAPSERKMRPAFNPIVAWSIILLVSIALWCGLGLAISSLVSALV